jgi:spermidine synthase
VTVADEHDAGLGLAAMAAPGSGEPAADWGASSGAVRGAVFLVSLAAVLLQVSLMRLVAVRLHPLLMFAMIGVALLGYGAAGAILATRTAPTGATASDAMRRWLLGFAATALPAFLVVNAIDVPTDWLFGTVAGLPVLLFFYAVLTVPFLFAGFAMSIGFSAHTSDVNRLYFADLVGAGLGSVLAVVGLPPLGGLALLALAGVFGALAALVLALARGHGAALPATLAVLGLGAVALFAIRPPVDVHFASDKHGSILASHAKPGGLRTDFSRWSHFGRVDVTEPFDTLPPQFGGDLSPQLGSLRIRQRMLMLDGQAPAFMYHVTPPYERIEFFAATSQSPAHLLRPKARVLVIGVGGATDLLLALSQGATHVTGVELNPVNAHVVQRVFADEVGHVLDDPRVTFVVAEGRNFAARDRGEYDVVQLSGVDTGAAHAGWGLATMPESYVYTTEAFRDLLHRLAPGGILTITRDTKLAWAHRVAAIARAALEGEGLEPDTRIAILEGKVYGWATLLVKREPFSTAEMDTLREFSTRWDFPVVYDPLVPHASLYDRVIREALVADDMTELRPATDDWPFLFLSFRWVRLLDIVRRLPAPLQNPLVFLLVNVVGLALVAALMIGWPLLRLRTARASTPGTLARIGYFSALGAGFMLVEVGLMQRFTIFLGNPAFAVATVLGALLVASGIGSGLARAVPAQERPLVPLAIAWIVAAQVLLASPLLPALLGGFLWLPLPARVAICIAVVALAGLPMGIPFPAGLARVAPFGRERVAWAWGINGMVSVVSSLASYVVGMMFGYTAMFVAAGALYGFALACWPALRRDPQVLAAADVDRVGAPIPG